MKNAVSSHHESSGDNYLISDNPALLNLDVIHSFLVKSYWAEGIPKSLLEEAVKNSLCFGIYDKGVQVGFARVVTDQATFCYLCDVFVLEAHRKKGLAKLLMKSVLSHPKLQGLRRMMLATKDAHGLYGLFGFKPLERVERFMAIENPKVYHKFDCKGATGNKSPFSPTASTR